MRLHPGTISVHFGTETKLATLYKKRNGGFVYWSPFTGARTLIRRPIRRLWEASRVRQLEARIESSRRCPERAI